MKQLPILLLFLLFSCNAIEKKQDKAKIILGKWSLTTYKQHILEIRADSILYRLHPDRSTYKLYGDSIKTKNDHFHSENSYDLKFKGNDTLILNGTDGEHIYTRTNQ